VHRKLVVKSVSPVKHVSHAKAAVKAAVNAVVVALNVAMTHRSLRVANKRRLPMATHLTCVMNARHAPSSQSPQTLQRQATSHLQAKMTPKNAHPANAAAVTVMVASAVNVVTVPSRRQTKQSTPTPRPLRQRSKPTPKLDQPQLTSPAPL
jgi:hypothetical protein